MTKKDAHARGLSQQQSSPSTNSLFTFELCSTAQGLFYRSKSHAANELLKDVAPKQIYIF